MGSPPSWPEDGECVGRDPEMWVVDDQRRLTVANWHAWTACRSCVVRNECDERTVAGPRESRTSIILGGRVYDAKGDQIDEMIVLRRMGVLADVVTLPHGTPSAIKRHLAHGDELCEPCQLVHDRTAEAVIDAAAPRRAPATGSPKRGKMKAARTGVSAPAGPDRSPSAERRPAVQDATCPQSACEPARPSIDTDDATEPPEAAYGEIMHVAEWAIRECTHQAATIGANHTEAHEALESARLVLHRLVDMAVDGEALYWPSPRRVIARTPAYLELARPESAA